MTNKTEAPPPLTAEGAFVVAMMREDVWTHEHRAALDAIADGRATVISAEELAAKDAEISRLRDKVRIIVADMRLSNLTINSGVIGFWADKLEDAARQQEKGT